MQIDISVVLLSYNHEKYISQAIDSIIIQNFIGKWELIIVDDFSKDNTREIIENYSLEYPNLIKAIYNLSNLGLSKNYEKAIQISKGKYIAYLEGDDYWTDNKKLQKQFNFLEKNTQFILAFHDFIFIDEFGKSISEKNLSNPNLKRHRSQREMIMGCLIHQNTIMFRNIVGKFPIGFFLARNHDTFIIAYLSRWGKAGYVTCSPLHYRIHKESLWSSLSSKKKHLNGLITFLIILFYVSPKYYSNVFLKIGTKFKSIFTS